MSEKIKIAVLVSGGGTNLQALIDAEKSGIIKSGHIVRVISNKPGAYALERAAAAGIPSATVVSAGKDRREFEKELLECLDGARAQIVVLAGFMRVLSPEFVSAVKQALRILWAQPEQRAYLRTLTEHLKEYEWL